MKLNPLHDRVVVKRIGAETKTSSGIFIPDNAQEKPDQGIVLAVGAGRRTEEGALVPMSLAVNDRVLFGKHAATPIKVDGNEYHILREDDVMAIVE